MKRKFSWEHLPFNIIYAPMVFLWIYYWVKSRRFWFFSNVNPIMYFSGFEGETKEKMFEYLPPEYSPITIYIQAKEDFNSIIQKTYNAGLRFPVAVKPDVGTKGLLFRKIENEAQLIAYHKLIPFTYVVQELVTMPLELSIFYVRYPGKKKGKITGLIAKEYLFVQGDGTHTLEQLIDAHPKAFMIAQEQKHKHKNKLNCVVKNNEIFYLNELGNHNRGARFINLYKEIDEHLLCTIDKLNHYSRQYYYGRYDIKTTSLEDLKCGKNISILEFNGVGSEPNHIYDIGLSYRAAVKIIATHWKYMYEIGRINYKKGFEYIPFFKGIKMLRDSLKNTKLMQQLDLECNL